MKLAKRRSIAPPSPGRQCAPEWSCNAEGFPACNFFKPWTTCHCDPDGRWTCVDECQRRGCPDGPYPGGGMRAHTGGACTGPAECPYLTNPPGVAGVVVCRCVSGRFQCPDEPPGDGGLLDGP